MARKRVPHDGNTACAHVAHATNEVIAIYPITPSSTLGEISDEKSAAGQQNIWGQVPSVSELQSEAGAAGAVHGALCAGTLTTTFTASQGLLLMIPNMYKIAGELLPTVFHVTARSIACQGLSIFGDHSDVMAVRQTGFGLLSSASVQEAMDFALIAQAATLESRIPFVHFYEGFRVSHEVQKIEEITFDDMRAMIDDKLVEAHRKRAMSPDHPTLRGTSQNPDVYFTGRETVNKYYQATPAIVQKYMDKFAKLVGRQYKLFEYLGDANAERVIICMGCGCETIQETAETLNAKGAKVGLLKVRLFRPFDPRAILAVMPASVKKIAVLDRTKEPGSLGEPLYEDVRTAIGEGMHEKYAPFSTYPVVIGGRYGLGSAEFTPAMVKGVYDELAKPNPRNHFMVGPKDDVTNASIDFDPAFSVEDDQTFRGLFYGLGNDGTVGANKNSIKIIGQLTENYAQGYFVYDSKKAGAMTVSHLRFGPKPIHRPYLIAKANFLACHNFSFLEKYDMLQYLQEGGTFLLTSEYGKDAVWSKIPGRVQKQIIDKKLQFYVIDAVKIAADLGLGSRINVIMQTAFFRISAVMDQMAALKAIKDAIKKTYGNKGEKVVEMNNAAVDQTLANIQKVEVPAKPTNPITEISPVPASAPEFVRNVTAKILKQEGETVTVKQMPADGVWPVGTTQYEKRNIAVEIPVWDPAVCIQCHRCSLLCPHATIRPKAYEAKWLDKAPKGFKSADAKGKELAGLKYTLQVAPEDCTGCTVCVENCPMKEKGAIKMQPQTPLREQEAKNWEFFLSIPDTDTKYYQLGSQKGSQFVRPLFEFSGACPGCGETPYVKLVSQIYGDRALIANATGCSSIYGGNLPTTPYTTRADGRGPTWNNSLFEDPAEVALGMRAAVDSLTGRATMVAKKIVADVACDSAVKEALGKILATEQKTKDQIDAVRVAIDALKPRLAKAGGADCAEMLTLLDYLANKSVWAFGGDGWAYDIGYGGLDHVLASGRDIKVMVLDTEVYSNTGGQSSKSTPMGAVAKFAAGGKPTGKKDLCMMAMSYGYIYVARVALGANPSQAIKAFMEAGDYNGPALVLCYCQCREQGVDLTTGYEEQKNAVACGHWPLYRYNPALALAGKNALQLDSKDPTLPLTEYALRENRYKMLQRSQPEVSKRLLESAQAMIHTRWAFLKQMAGVTETKA